MCLIHKYKQEETETEEEEEENNFRLGKCEIVQLKKTNIKIHI